MNDRKNEILTSKKNDIIVTRSNEFISAKYKSTLLESKLLVLSISRLQTRSYANNKDLTVSFTARELKDILKEEDSKSIYTKLKYSARHLVQNYFVMEDKKSNNFNVSVIVRRCTYENGVFTVCFDESIREHIFKLSNNYTPMKLSVLMAFSKGKTNSSYRIYEVLRTHLYKVKSEKEHVVIRYDLYDFMMYTGQVDINNDKIQAAIEAGKSAEFIIKNVADVSSKRNTTWGDFKRRILIPAMEEINEISDIHVAFTPVKGGSGSKVVALDFDLSKNLNYTNPVIEDIKVDADMLIRFEDLIPENMSVRDQTAIVKAASGNFSRIEQIYKMSLKQSEVTDLVAWMIAGLREGWDLNEGNGIHLVRGEYAGDYQEFADEANAMIDADFIEVPQPTGKLIDG